MNIQIPNLLLSERTELHIRTDMSDLSGMCSISELIYTVDKKGITAFAITDINGVQAFPAAARYIDDSCKKPLYGAEVTLNINGNLTSCMLIVRNNVGRVNLLCFQRAREIYGSRLPEPVDDRLNRELDYISQKNIADRFMLVKQLTVKARDMDYVVVFNDSVIDTALVSYLLGINDLNPLPGHYYCKDHYYGESDISFGCKYTLYERDCPVCEMLLHNGF